MDKNSSSGRVTFFKAGNSILLGTQSKHTTHSREQMRTENATSLVLEVCNLAGYYLTARAS